MPKIRQTSRRLVIVLVMESIGKFRLHQQGGYVCRTEFVYIDESGRLMQSAQTGNQTLGFTYDVDPHDLGIKDGTTVWMKIWVMWGNDNQAQQGFIYQRGNPKTAVYTCSGTTLSNHLSLDGIEGAGQASAKENQNAANV